MAYKKIQPKTSTSGLRASLKGMTDKEAVEWLLGLIEEQDQLSLAISRYLKVGHIRAYIMTILWRARNRVATHEHILTQLEELKGGTQENGRPTLAVHVTQLRKSIKKAGFPITIRSVWGGGYSLEITDPDWVAPWDKE